VKKHPFQSGIRLIAGLFFALSAVILSPLYGKAAANPQTQELLDQVNSARADAGVSTLSPDSSLEGIAFERSGDMVTRHYFSHVTPDGTDVFKLMDERGVHYSIAGENLAWSGGGPDYPISFIVRSFMESPPHRENLLNPAFRQIGIGVAGEGESLFITVLLRG